MSLMEIVYFRFGMGMWVIYLYKGLYYLVDCNGVYIFDFKVKVG